MSPRCMLSVVFLHVWRGRALSLIAFLITLLAPLAALADDNPYHDPELCVRGGQVVTIDGKLFTKININLHLEREDPKRCGLRTAYPMYPILGDSGKPLSQQEWLRSVYAANQGSHPTVLRGCVPTKAAPADATEEEKAYCPRGVTNYMDVPTNGGWIAWILIPRQPVSTWGEKQTAAAKAACAEATTPEAKKACQDAGYQASTTSAQTPAPVIADTTKFSKELDAKIADLQTKLAESEKTLGETKERLAEAGRSNFRLSFYGFLVSAAFIIGVIRNWRLKKKLETTEKSLAATKQDLQAVQDELRKSQDDLQKAQKSQGTVPPNVAKLQTQLAEVDKKHKELVTEYDQAKTKWQTELAEANRQKDEAVRQREEANQKSSIEVTGLRDELGRKNREVQYNERLVAQLEGQVGGFRYRIKELENQQAANDNEFIALLAEKDQTIAALRDRVNDLQDQLKAENDNAAQATTPPTETPPPTTETTTPPTTVTSEPAITLRGFPAVTPPADQGQPQSTQQRDLQSEADAFRNGMPEIIFLLGGDPRVMVDAEPEAIMIRAIELASDKNAKVVEVESSLKDARDQRKTAEDRVSAHERTISQLSEQIDHESQAKAQAISREIVLQEVVDGFQDKATEPEKKALEALFKAARLEQEVATLQFSVHRAETKQQVAERECDQAIGAFHQLNLLYTLSQAALQKAVSGSDCLVSPEVQARDSWAGPEAVTTPRMVAVPFVKFEPSPHPKTIPMPPPKPEPEPEKSGQGNG